MEQNENRAIITVIGADKIGIIAQITSCLAQNDVNIVDISQTILSGSFIMMMSVDFEKTDKTVNDIKNALNDLSRTLNVNVSVLHERVFDAMHRI